MFYLLAMLGLWGLILRAAARGSGRDVQRRQMGRGVPDPGFFSCILR